MAKPTEYPEWATSLVVDGTSGQDNRVEPTAGLKSDGWPRIGFPPRQYANWQFYKINQWIEHFDTSLNQFDCYSSLTPDEFVNIAPGRVLIDGVPTDTSSDKSICAPQNVL